MNDMDRVRWLLLPVAAAGGVFMVGCQNAEIKTDGPRRTPPMAPATSSPGAAAKARTILFMDWRNVGKGRLNPIYDPNRLTDEARKSFEEQKKTWGIESRLGRHGMQAFHVPSGIRITVEKARKTALWLMV